METSWCPNSFEPNLSSSSWVIEQGQSTTIWTEEENKRFESALAIFDEKVPNRWFHVAAMIPGKSVYDVMNQYRELVEDVSDIEAGLVPLPGYLTSSFTLDSDEDNNNFPGFDHVHRKRTRTHHTYDQERKKGVPWTEDEHRRFLSGLEKHGKGDWRNISRNFVISKTPTQVASHAQKYYLRQLCGGKDKRRPSIHDITTMDVKTAETSNNNKPNEIHNNAFQIPEINNRKTSLDWNHSNNNDGALTMFDSALVARSNDIIGSRYMVNIGASAPGYLFQSTPGIYF